ncbi:MAG: DUF559 domain-containing protein, partial [Acidimicrobiales bacterium]
MKTIVDEQIARWMRCQHGLVTRTQANDCGLTVDGLRWRVCQGVWVQVQRGVYRNAAACETRRMKILAACLAGGPGTVASHRAAGWLWGLIPPGAAVIEITMAHDRRRSLRGVEVHRSRHPEPAVERHGIPVTTPLATMVALAGVLSRSALEDALERAARQRMLTGADLYKELRQLNGSNRDNTKGATSLYAVLAERGYPAVEATELERRTLFLLQQAALPNPVRELPAGPGNRYRIDFTWPPTRVMVEVDGFDAHSTPEALRADLARQNELVSGGWIPLRYTWADITKHPDHVVAEIRAMLARSSGG